MNGTTNLKCRLIIIIIIKSLSVPNNIMSCVSHSKPQNGTTNVALFYNPLRSIRLRCVWPQGVAVSEQLGTARCRDRTTERVNPTCPSSAVGQNCFDADSAGSCR